MRLKLNNVMSPVSNLIAGLYCFIGLLVIFEPGWREFLVLIFVDYLALVALIVADKRVFVRFYPFSSHYFPSFAVDQLATSDRETLRVILTDLYAFPRRRGVYVWFSSIPKVIPAGLIMLFVWPHESYGSQAAKIFLFETIFITAFAVISYFEIHAQLSKSIRALYEKTSHKDVFFSVAASESGGSLFRAEILALGAISAFSVALLVVQLLSANVADGSTYSLTLRLAAMLGLGFLLQGRIFQLSRRIMFSGLEAFVRSIRAMDFSKEQPLVALHTSAELNAMERAFNLMSIRLRESQAELTEWVQYESDQSRFRSLGEVAGLVVHDLGTPLHVLKYSVEELIKTSGISLDSVVRARLERSLDKASTLVESLRAYLKDGHRGEAVVEFKEANGYVLRVLALEFSERLRNRTVDQVVQVDPDALLLSINCARLDLIQVLDNLYRNALQNMIEHHVPEPLIHVRLAKVEDGFATLCLEDRGTGISAEVFESMTSSHIGKGGFRRRAAEKGLGLRLTRRLIEHLNGGLTVDSEPRECGTRMLLRLPVARSQTDALPIAKKA